MKRIILFLVGVFISVAAAFANCPECGEYVESEMWCSNHGMCVVCAAMDGTHCRDCGACHEELGDGNYCPGCGVCSDCEESCEGCGSCMNCTDAERSCLECKKCEECLDEYSCLGCHKCEECVGDLCNDCFLCFDCGLEAGNHCAECNDHIDGESSQICKGCHVCVDCKEICSECATCGECAGADFCSDCGMCNDCAKEAKFHCLECGEHDDDMCELCWRCPTHIEEEHTHCSECGVCYVEVNPCELCVGSLHCEDCTEFVCEGCDKCFYAVPEEFCENCGYCIECAVIEILHCQICEEHEDICEYCGLCYVCYTDLNGHCPNCEECYSSGIGYCLTHETDHCDNCASDYLCDVCGECFLDDIDDFYEEISMCVECAKSEGSFCEGCEDIGAGVCPECNLCIDCQSERHVHCQECDECLGENGACEFCGMCEDCAISYFIHCAACNECWGSEGEVCEDCGFCADCSFDLFSHCVECESCFGGENGVCENCGKCIDCALSLQSHCENCETCTEDVTVCEECGLCADCAEDEGIHCSVCHECRPDDRCPNEGNHCADCCVENGWLCNGCDVCMEAEGLEKCETCEMCIECCLVETAKMNCIHNICVESKEWETHYCDICHACKSECEHKSEYVAHQCTFGEDGVCSVCKSSVNDAPVIYRQPTNVTCPVANYAGIIAKDGKAKYDTVSIMLEALGDDLQYQWYSEVSGVASAVKNQTGDGDYYLSGATTNKLTLTAPSSCGQSATKYYCVVTNANGSVTTNKVCLTGIHSMAYEKSIDSKTTVTIHRPSTASTTDSIVTYYASHTVHCIGKECTAGAGTKQKHVGDWTVSANPDWDVYGSRYRVCELCGETQWENINPLREDGYPQITQQPKSIKGVVAPEFEDFKGTYLTDTISFEVKAMGKELKYEWHELEYSGSSIIHDDILAQKNEDNLFVKGADEARMTITVSPFSCKYFKIMYYCLVSNEMGVVSSDTVSLTSKCHWKYVDYDELPDECLSSVEIKDKYPYSGFNTKYSDYHYKCCASNDEIWHNLESGQMPHRASHNYGKWSRSTEHTGYAFKECKDCGEKFWTKCTTEEGYPTILVESGDSKRKKVPDFIGLRDHDNVQIYDTISFWVEAMDAQSYKWYWTNRIDGTKQLVKDGASANNFGDDYQYYVKGTNTNRLTITMPSYACWDALFFVCEVSNNKGVTTSKYMKTNATHDIQWRSSANYAYSLKKKEYYYDYSYGGDELELELKPEKFKKIIYNCYEVGDSVFVKFDIYHYGLCCGNNCPKWNGEREKHNYGGWTVSVFPTATQYGSRYKKCKKCGEMYWDNIEPVADSQNPYLANCKSSYFKITTETLPDGVYINSRKRFQMEGKTISGVFLQNQTYSIISPDLNTWVSITDITKNGTLVTQTKKGDGKVTMSCIFPPVVYENNYPMDRCYIVDNPDLFTFSTRALVDIKTVFSQVKVGDEHSYDMALGESRMGHIIAVDGDDSTAIVRFDEPTLLYEGQPFCWSVGSGVKQQVYRRKVIKALLDKVDMYIVSASNDTIYLDETSQKSLLNGTVLYSYEDASISLYGANLKTIHLGEKKLNGKDLTINVMEGKNKIQSQIGNAVDVLGKVIFHGEPGVTLNVKSAKGNGIQADCFESMDEKSIWTLSCEGYRYGMKIDQIRYRAGAELHVKCADFRDGGYAAISPMKKAGFIDAALSEDWVDYGFSKRYFDVETKEEISGVYVVAGIDDEDIFDSRSELYFYVNPHVYFGDFQEGFAMGARSSLENIQSDLISKGKMSYDFSTHTLTLDNVVIDDPDYAERYTLLFDDSYLDTLYVNLVGENVIYNYSSFCEGVVFVNGGSVDNGGANVKFIGNGTLRAIGKIGFGLGAEKPVLTVGGHATLDADETDDYSFYGTSGYGSKLVVERKASIWAAKGIFDLGDVVVENFGEKLTAEELAAVGGAFTENAVRPTRVFGDNIYCCEYDKESRKMLLYPNSDSKSIHIGDNYKIRVGNVWLSSMSELEGVEYNPSTKKLTISDSEPLVPTLTNEALYIGINGVSVVFENDVIISGGEMAPAVTIDASNVSFTCEGSVIVNVTSASESAPGILINENASLIVKNIDLELDDNASVMSKAAWTTGKNAANSTLRLKNTSVKFGDNASIYGLNVEMSTCLFEDTTNAYEEGSLSQVVNKSTGNVSGNFNIIRFDSSLLPPVSTDFDDVITNGEGFDYSKPVYDILGRPMMISTDYCGVVVQNGRRYLLTGK